VQAEELHHLPPHLAGSFQQYYLAKQHHAHPVVSIPHLPSRRVGRRSRAPGQYDGRDGKMLLFSHTPAIPYVQALR